MAVDQGGRDGGLLWSRGYRCEAGQQVPLPLTPREMTEWDRQDTWRLVLLLPLDLMCD